MYLIEFFVVLTLLGGFFLCSFLAVKSFSLPANFRNRLRWVRYSRIACLVYLLSFAFVLCMARDITSKVKHEPVIFVVLPLLCNYGMLVAFCLSAFAAHLYSKSE